MKLSTAVSSMPRSGIREIMDLAWATEGVIHLEVGEPDVPTPRHALEAAHRAALDGATRYTPNAGMPELREALAAKITRVNGIQTRPEDVVVTAGGVQALYNALRVLLDAGDTILLPDPGWPNYRMMARLLGLDVATYELSADEGFRLDADRLDALCTDSTRAVMINSPSNPVGLVADEADLRALLDVAARRGLWLVSDECYDQVVFEGQHRSLGALEGDGQVVTAFSFSKTYAMTGLRVGYLTGPSEVMEAAAKTQEPLVSCVNAPAQVAALAALQGPQDAVDEMCAAYRARRDEAVDLLRAGGVEVYPPKGAFYLWIDVSRAGIPSHEFARRLVQDHLVAVVPGGVFGETGEGRVRASLATARDALLEGLARLVTLHEQLRTT